MFWSKKKKLPSSLVEEAKKHPNGYVYEFDSRFHPEGAIPNYAIKGAWPVGGNGVISGEFEPNPHYSEERIVKLLKLAAKNPNKQIPDIDYRLDGEKNVPIFTVRGYWPVDANGKIGKAYNPNPKFDKEKSSAYIKSRQS